MTLRQRRWHLWIWFLLGPLSAAAIMIGLLVRLSSN